MWYKRSGRRVLIIIFLTLCQTKTVVVTCQTFTSVTTHTLTPLDLWHFSTKFRFGSLIVRISSLYLFSCVLIPFSLYSARIILTFIRWWWDNERFAPLFFRSRTRHFRPRISTSEIRPFIWWPLDLFAIFDLIYFCCCCWFGDRIFNLVPYLYPFLTFRASP